jgi:hypothetical protein
MIGASKDWRRDPGERPLPLALRPNGQTGDASSFSSRKTISLSPTPCGSASRAPAIASCWPATRGKPWRRRPSGRTSPSSTDGVSGPELARALAATGARIVVCTGYSAERAAELLQGLPVAGTLVKPVPWEDLWRVLARVERELAPRGGVKAERKRPIPRAATARRLSRELLCATWA